MRIFLFLQFFKGELRRAVRPRVVAERRADEGNGRIFHRNVHPRIHIAAQGLQKGLPLGGDAAPQNDRLRAEDVEDVQNALAERGNAAEKMNWV